MGTKWDSVRLGAAKPSMAMSLGAVALVTLGLAACTDRGPQGSDVLADHFQLLSEITLDEHAGAVSGAAKIRAAGDGELLVVELEERRIRSFSSSGALRWSVRYPTLREPLVAIRLTSTRVLVADAHGQAGLVLTGDSVGGPRPAETFGLQGGVRMMDDVDAISDSLVVYSVRPVLASGAHIPALHIVDPLRRRTVRSLFEPQMSVPVDGLARFGGWVQSSVRGDTIASVFAPIDTIYLHSVGGESLDRIPLPTTSFRVVDRPRRPGERIPEWYAGVSFASDVFWLPAGDFLVQFLEYRRGSARPHLLGVSRSGDFMFQIDDSPWLHAMLPNGDLLFSVRGTDAPNRLVVARSR